MTGGPEKRRHKRASREAPPTLNRTTDGACVDLVCAALPSVYGRFLRLLTLSPSSRDVVENALRFAVGLAVAETTGMGGGEWTVAQHTFLKATLGLERA
jgi:hypothetical protein